MFDYFAKLFSSFQVSGTIGHLDFSLYCQASEVSFKNHAIYGQSFSDKKSVNPVWQSAGWMPESMGKYSVRRGPRHHSVNGQGIVQN